MKPLGLYLHIPFCRSKCLYCDFCSLPARTAEMIEAYVNALCREIAGKKELCADHSVQTIYFGGGTPTLLSAEQLERIMKAVRNAFFVFLYCEISPFRYFTVKARRCTRLS